jgi:hypothetical protein
LSPSAITSSRIFHTFPVQLGRRQNHRARGCGAAAPFQAE